MFDNKKENTAAPAVTAAAIAAGIQNIGFANIATVSTSLKSPHDLNLNPA